MTVDCVVTGHGQGQEALCRDIASVSRQDYTMDKLYRNREFSIVTDFSKFYVTKDFPCCDIAPLSRQGTTEARDDRACDRSHDRNEYPRATRIRARPSTLGQA